MARTLLDFLYHDARRITSFLAQLGGRGHIKEFKEQIQSGEVAEKSRDGEFTGTLLGVGGTLKYGKGESQSASETASLTYDPLWMNAITLQEFLEEQGVVKHSLDETGLGDFVILEGQLFVLDTKIWREAYRLDSWLPLIMANAKRAIEARIEAGDKDAIEAGENASLEHHIKAETDLLGLLEPQVQALLVSQKGLSWSILTPENLTAPRDEITLKFGSTAQGRWKIFAILDGMMGSDLSKDREVLLKLVQLSGGHRFVAEVVDMNSRIRSTIGRPYPSFSLTPLTIFREVEVG